MTTNAGDTPRQRFDAIVDALADLFWQNSQDPGAVLEPDAERLTIRFTTVPSVGGMNDRYWEVDLHKTPEQSIDTTAVAQKLYASFVAQRNADAST